MTTDTIPKAFSQQVQIGGATVTITGISKGAGMIRPNMATMLGFMATDAKIDPSLIQPLAKLLADASFNRVTIDGDTSTNDSFVVIATQKAAHATITSLDSADGQALVAAMQNVARLLAQAIVRDGEGATKFITIQVEGGRDAAECKQVAYADRPFAAGEDRVLRQRPEPGPHPGRRRLCGHRRPRPDRHRPVPGRRARGRQGRAQPVVPRGRRPARDEAERDHGARRPGPRQRQRNRLDLRPQPRLRDHQRRLPVMNEQFQKLIERAEQLITRIESILPQPLSAPADWNASIAWRYRRRNSGHGVLEPVKHVATMALDSLKEIDVQKEKIERNTRSSSKASRPTTCC
jgi:hypothetical protein